MNNKWAVPFAATLMLFQAGCDNTRAMAPVAPSRDIYCDDPNRPGCDAPPPPDPTPPSLPPGAVTVVESPGFHLARARLRSVRHPTHRPVPSSRA
jgi:hypothetical protein